MFIICDEQPFVDIAIFTDSIYREKLHSEYYGDDADYTYHESMELLKIRKCIEDAKRQQRSKQKARGIDR